MLVKNCHVDLKPSCWSYLHTVKPVLSYHSKRPKIGFQDQLLLNAGQKYCRMLQREHSAILSTFIKLPFVIKVFVLSIFEWPLKTGLTAYKSSIFQISTAQTLYRSASMYSEQVISPDVYILYCYRINSFLSLSFYKVQQPWFLSFSHRPWPAALPKLKEIRKLLDGLCRIVH